MLLKLTLLSTLCAVGLLVLILDCSLTNWYPMLSLLFLPLVRVYASSYWSFVSGVSLVSNLALLRVLQHLHVTSLAQTLWFVVGQVLVYSSITGLIMH